MTGTTLLLSLDLAGTFAFALNGAITGVKAAQLDIIGMLALGMVTALGGGILRDILIDALPPATSRDWRYLAVAAAGALIAFFLSKPLRRYALAIDLADAAGLSLFCVTGATKSLEQGLGACAGGYSRGHHRRWRRDDPRRAGGPGSGRAHQRPVRHPRPRRGRDRGYSRAHRPLRHPGRTGAALACFLIRLLGIRYDLNAPKAREAKNPK